MNLSMKKIIEKISNVGISYFAFCILILSITSIVNGQGKLTDEDLQDYLPVDANQSTIDEISELSSSVCEVRSNLSESHYTIFDPVTDQPVRTVVFSEPDRFFCSAVIINDNTFLTAAHCYQGTVEQYLQRGKIRLPGVKYKIEGRKITWNFNSKCFVSNPPKDTDCSSTEVKAHLEERLNKVSLKCRNSNNEEFNYYAPAEKGWPSPRFSGNRPDFDVSVSRIEGKFDSSLARSKFMVEYHDILKSVINNGHSCKTMGHGPVEFSQTDHAKIRPQFKILHTPVTYLNPYRLASIEGDYLRPGDSGGGLFCKGLDQKYYLVGINSRIYYATKEINVFSLNSFNSDWINQILRNPNLVHEGARSTESPVIYHNQALEYEKIVIKKTMKNLNHCIKNVNPKFDGGFKVEMKKELKVLNKQHKFVEKLHNNKNETAVFKRSKNKELLHDADELFDYCQQFESLEI